MIFFYIDFQSKNTMVVFGILMLLGCDNSVNETVDYNIGFCHLIRYVVHLTLSY